MKIFAGTYLITPNSDWYKCYTKHKVPFIDLRLDVKRNISTDKIYLEVTFAQKPDFHLDFDKAISQLLKHQICNTIVQSGYSGSDLVEELSDEYIFQLSNYLTDYSEDPFEDDNFIMPLLDDDQPVKRRQSDFIKSGSNLKPRFSTNAQDTFMKQFLMFGCPGRHKLAKFHKYNIGVRSFPSNSKLDDKKIFSWTSSTRRSTASLIESHYIRTICMCYCRF